MDANHSLRQNPIGDFIEDDAFYRYRKALDGMDKPIMSIYIFATLSLLLFVFYVLMHYQTADWFTVVINLAVIAVYFCLAAYSSFQPFTAFVTTIAFVTFILLCNILFAAEPNVRGIIIQILLIVLVASKLEDAKFVQAYKKELAKGVSAG
jgi:tetrahydromethanopterin S-methyltransferase subunit C